jgi:hypothetical protein
MSLLRAVSLSSGGKDTSFFYPSGVFHQHFFFFPKYKSSTACFPIDFDQLCNGLHLFGLLYTAYLCRRILNRTAC